MLEQTDARLTVDEPEAASLLGLSRPTLHRLRRDGRLPFVRVGSRVLYRRRDLERFLDGCTRNGERQTPTHTRSRKA
ncbi:MAG: helix-turn-helix domain-containing protein [Blastocatellia bacterium]|nr:helix-turn-helix domain-containing protein [Blastocatellia bacterium]